MNNPFLTIGMATYDDYHGVYFSIQSLRMHHKEVMDEVEILIVDNNPQGQHGQECKNLAGWSNNVRYIPESRAEDKDAEPFEIPMQGLGIFSCKKDAWPGFNSAFRGFGGEEGYIHEKFRQRGDKCLCLPFLRWVHRFGRPDGVKYPLTRENKVRNYIIGHIEMGLNLEPLFSHFSEYMALPQLEKIFEECIHEMEKQKK